MDTVRGDGRLWLGQWTVGDRNWAAGSLAAASCDGVDLSVTCSMEITPIMTTKCVVASILNTTSIPLQGKQARL